MKIKPPIRTDFGLKTPIIIIAPLSDVKVPENIHSKAYRTFNSELHKLGVLIESRILRKFPDFPCKPGQIIYPTESEHGRLMAEAFIHLNGAFVQMIPELCDLTTNEQMDKLIQKMLQIELLNPGSTIIIVPEAYAAKLAAKIAGCDVRSVPPIHPKQFYAIPKSSTEVEMFGPDSFNLEPNIVLPEVIGEPEYGYNPKVKVYGYWVFSSLEAKKRAEKEGLPPPIEFVPDERTPVE